MDSLPLLSMQHAIMTLNNPSGAEIMIVENVKVHLTPKIFFAKIISLFCGVTWRQNFLIWLNPRISTPRQNRV